MSTTLKEARLPAEAAFDMTEEELRDAIKARIDDPKGLLPQMGKNRLQHAFWSNHLPYFVREDGTAHWPSRVTQMYDGDTESAPVELKTADEINAAIAAGHTVLYNYFAISRRPVHAARTMEGRVSLIEIQTNQPHGEWEIGMRSGFVFYDSEEGQHG